ncbi:MAG TPA: hypothetical protein VF189_00435 [Patescibacteria group bacterium]
MSKSEYPNQNDFPDWLRDILKEEPHLRPFRDASGQWRDKTTKNPLYPSMNTSPLPPWVRKLKEMADRGELPSQRQRELSDSRPRRNSGPPPNPPKK